MKNCLLALLLAGPAAWAGEAKGLEMVVQRGHSTGVFCAVFSPDGRLVLSGSGDGAVKLWSADGLLIRTISDGDGVHSLAFSPDGGSFVTSNLNLRSLDGKLLRRLAEVKSPSVTFSPDGRLVAYASANEVVIVRSDGSGQERTLRGHTAPVIAVAYSVDGKYIVSGAGRSAETGGWEKQGLGGSGAVSKDATVRLWSAKDGSLVKEFSGHRGGISAVALSPDNALIVSGSRDTQVRIWDAASGTSKTRTNHASYVTGAAFSLDGKLFATCGQDGKIYIMDRDGRTVRTLRPGSTAHLLKGKSINSVAFSPDGSKVLAAGGDTGIVTLDEDRWVRLWGVDGRPLRTLGGQKTVAVKNAWFASDGLRFAAADAEGRVSFWSVLGNLQDSFSEYGKQLSNFALSADLRTMYAADGKDIVVWNRNSGERPRLPTPALIFGAATGASGRFVAAAGNDHRVRVFSAKGGLSAEHPIDWAPTGTKRADGMSHMDSGWVDSLAMSPDETEVVWSSGLEGRLQFAKPDAPGVSKGPANPSAAKKLVYSSDGKTLLAAYTGGGIGVYKRDGASMRRVKGFPDPGLWVKTQSLAFSPDGASFAAGHSDGSVLVRDLEGKTLRALSGHEASVDALAYSPGGKLLLSGSEDGTLRLWNLDTGAWAALIGAGKEWIIYTEDGYFDSSRSGGGLVAAVKGVNAYAADQFALRYNCSDIILERLGVGTPEVREHYRSQYLRRLRKAGISEDQLAADLRVPEAAVSSIKVDGKFAQLSLRFSDSASPLKRYNVFVNDVPLFGAYGKPLSGMKAEAAERVELTAGENKIEVSCLNSRGAESYRALAFADYKGEAAGDLYFLGFGVSKYKDSSLDLQYADKDAKDLAALFSRMKGGYGAVRAKTYLNEEVTPEAIKASKAFLKDAKPDDAFVLFIAGHGVHDQDKESTYYFITHNTDVKDLPRTAADFDLIEDILQGIAPRRKLFLMDTCESGEAEEGAQTQIVAMAGSRGLGSRGMKKAGSAAPLQAAAAPRSHLLDRDRYIYNDLVRRSGAVVFSSSKGGELSYENSADRNGLFTKEVLAAFSGAASDKNSDGALSADELRDFVSAAVAADSGGAQHPTVDRDNIYQKFSFPVVR